jgi:hypothetical protein
MLPHPSREVIEAAEQRVTANPGSTTANQRYSELVREFRPTALTVTSGLRAMLDEIESETGIQPPMPGTLRGRLGSFLIRFESRALWWLLRALRLRDRSLRLTEGVISEMEKELGALRSRVHQLEQRAQHREERE